MTELNDTIEKINLLRKERNAIILAHNYQIPEVQEIADFGGDSLELARKGALTDAEVIVFCGVHFMAETSALLSPEKTVLLPDENAGCPMADMATENGVRRLREKHPGAVAVCYVNSTAAVKAVCDVCCTSANAVDIVGRISAERDIIFVPDQYLGGHVERVTGRKLIMWPGYCTVHVTLKPAQIDAARKEYPGTPVIIHPECPEELALMADEVLSTGGMVRFAKETQAKTVIVGTENGLLHRLQKENPDKQFMPVSQKAICKNMKKINLDKVLRSLETLQPRITVDPQVAEAAKVAVENMLGDGPIEPRSF